MVDKPDPGVLLFPRMGDRLRTFLVEHGASPKRMPKPIRIHIEDSVVSYEQFVLDEFGEPVVRDGKPLTRVHRVYQRFDHPRPPKRPWFTDDEQASMADFSDLVNREMPPWMT